APQYINKINPITVMSISLNEYRAELISNILVAGSQEEVKDLIGNSLENLERNKVTTENIAGFVDWNITYLEKLNPMNKEVMEWSNIQMARIYFQHIRRTS
ncbi:MAG: hypothetical protein ABI707_06535, partial [Ferruginibacter sp.]